MPQSTAPEATRDGVDVEGVFVNVAADKVEVTVDWCSVGGSRRCRRWRWTCRPTPTQLRKPYESIETTNIFGVAVEHCMFSSVYAFAVRGLNTFATPKRLRDALQWRQPDDSGVHTVKPVPWSRSLRLIGAIADEGDGDNNDARWLNCFCIFSTIQFTKSVRSAVLGDELVAKTGGRTFGAMWKLRAGGLWVCGCVVRCGRWIFLECGIVIEAHNQMTRNLRRNWFYITYL